MSLTRYYGLGGSGDSIVTAGTVLINGSIYFVDSTNGNDANIGTSRVVPVKTLAAAVALASEGDIIVLMEGYAEVLTANVTIATNLIIIGCGLSGNKPASTIGFNNTAQILLTGTVGFVQFRNIRFQARIDASANPRIDATSVNVEVPVFVGCWFECEATSETYALDMDHLVYTRLTDCTIESLASYNDTTQAPANAAMRVSAASLMVRAENLAILGAEGAWATQALAISADYVEFERYGPQLSALATLNIAGGGWVHATTAGGLTGVAAADTFLWTYAPGLGGDLGPTIITDGVVATQTYVIYVSSVIGSDSYDGKQRQRPLATLAAAIAIANATNTAQWVIVLAADHSEDLTSTITLTTICCTIIGEGRSSSGEPTATIGFDGDGASLVLNAPTAYLWNIRFTANKQANTSHRVVSKGPLDASGNYIRDCLFECDQYDSLAGLRHQGAAKAAMVHFRNVTFRSVQSDPSKAPVSAFLIDGSDYGFWLDDITVDGGASGFMDNAVSFNGYKTLIATNIRLLNGADIYASRAADVTTTVLHFASNTESTYVQWEASAV